LAAFGVHLSAGLGGDVVVSGWLVVVGSVLHGVAGCRVSGPTAVRLGG
jgi:hypothetical protein